MKINIEEFKCREYSDAYYTSGLFHGSEAQLVYPLEKWIVDEEKEFLRIGEIYDDHDLILGYKKNQEGIWGHYNTHWDGTFQLVSGSLKELCEGWYQKDSKEWCEMSSGVQWQEIAVFLKEGINRYYWQAENIKVFLDSCIETQQLTEFYIKAYKTALRITRKNGFIGRSFTNMVYMNDDLEKKALTVCFQKDFFDASPKVKEYNFNSLQEAAEEIKKWIGSSE